MSSSELNVLIVQPVQLTHHVTLASFHLTPASIPASRDAQSLRLKVPVANSNTVFHHPLVLLLR